MLKAGWISTVRLPRLGYSSPSLPPYLPPSLPTSLLPSLPRFVHPIPHSIQPFLIDPPLSIPYANYGRLCTTRLSSWSSILGTFVYFVTMYTSFAFSTRPVPYRSQSEILRCKCRVSWLVLSSSLPPCLVSSFPASLPPSRSLTPSSAFLSILLSPSPFRLTAVCVLPEYHPGRKS